MYTGPLGGLTNSNVRNQGILKHKNQTFVAPNALACHEK